MFQLFSQSFSLKNRQLIMSWFIIGGQLILDWKSQLDKKVETNWASPYRSSSGQSSTIPAVYYGEPICESVHHELLISLTCWVVSSIGVRPFLHHWGVNKDDSRRFKWTTTSSWYTDLLRFSRIDHDKFKTNPVWSSILSRIQKYLGDSAHQSKMTIHIILNMVNVYCQEI